jgi:xanthine dehydrogenase YagS FAD-binding subunit
MKNFAYAQPTSQAELITVLSSEPGQTELIGGGTDLMGLMKSMVVTPDCVVNVCDVREMRTIEVDTAAGEVRIGAALRLDEILADEQLERFTAIRQVIRNLGSMALVAQGTLGGELLRRPRCWYFRSGHGLLADRGRLVEEGDNRYHAILGNQGPAKFVNASRLAPALIALGATARVIGPRKDDDVFIPLAELYQTPGYEGQRENTLLSGQVLSQVIVPLDESVFSAAYEVRQGAGPDHPLACASAALRMAGSVVQEAHLTLGQVAPVPWVADAAAKLLVGQMVSRALAERVGRTAVVGAHPLSGNEYKVQLAAVSAKRAILMAAGLPTGGF